MEKIFLFLLFFTTVHLCIFSQNTAHPKLQFTSKGNNRVSVDSVYYYQISASDSSGNSISYSVEELPSWLKFNKANHFISGKSAKPGQFMIHLLASTADTTIHQRFMLTVFNRRTVNILVLGNSITNGTNRFNSFRRSLWQMLHAGNYNFDFIGSWNKHHMGGDVPDPDFDMDHDGHSGWTTHNILNPPDWDKQRGNINTWLKFYKPDIVLIELGTNDVFQCVPAKDAMNNISEIIHVLRNQNPHVRIFLAQIPPLGAQWADKKLCGTDTSYSNAIEMFNDHIVNLAAEKNASSSNIATVDLYTGVHPAGEMYDDIHPNDIGEKDMAERWFKAIDKYVERLE